MSVIGAGGATLTELDEATRALVRAAAVLAAGSEEEVRAELLRASSMAPTVWMEEVLLQTYLFAGFPRALNGMRAWRRATGRPAPVADGGVPDDARAEGERVCAQVYGSMYERLRVNVRELHPLLDEWMVSEGYGKVLSRPALDLPRRELCIIAACAATGQDRQLQSHLHGARNVGVAPEVVSQALEALEGVVTGPLLTRAIRLWERLRDDVH